VALEQVAALRQAFKPPALGKALGRPAS